jgi:hypothetical protein
VAGGYIGILTTMEAQRTWRNERLPILPQITRIFMDLRIHRTGLKIVSITLSSSVSIRETCGSISVFGLKRRKFAAKKSLGQF